MKLFSVDYKDLHLPSVWDMIQKEKIILVKELFQARELLELREYFYEWGNTQPSAYITNCNTYFEAKGDDHYYNSYNIDLPEEHPTAIPTFTKLRDFYRNISQNYEFNWSTKDNLKKWALRPQLIHYPFGGGFLGPHVHKLEPQRIGHITIINDLEKEKFQGGWTEFGDSNFVIRAIAKLGDVILFRNDIPHRVVKCEPNKPYVKSMEGRWSLVMAYKKSF